MEYSAAAQRLAELDEVAARADAKRLTESGGSLGRRQVRSPQEEDDRLELVRGSDCVCFAGLSCFSCVSFELIFVPQHPARHAMAHGGGA